MIHDYFGLLSNRERLHVILVIGRKLLVVMEKYIIFVS